MSRGNHSCRLSADFASSYSHARHRKSRLKHGELGAGRTGTGTSF
jgi:hypothetical protein